jgi:hypothetical protein
MPIAAAPNFEAWAEGIFLLIMGFLWLINRISTAVEVARRPPPVRRPLQPVPPPADAAQQAESMPRQRVAPQGQPRSAGESMQNEIDEFLRRATGRRDPTPQPGQAQRQRPAAGRPSVAGAKADPRRVRAAPTAVRTKSPPPAPVETIETPEAISEHVKQFLSMRQFDQRTSNLSSIDEKEREFDLKLKQTFSHELGHLKPSTLADGGDSAATAAALQPIPVNLNVLANLFRSGTDLKRAIALNEIFQRPEHRW